MDLKPFSYRLKTKGVGKAIKAIVGKKVKNNKDTYSDGPKYAFEVGSDEYKALKEAKVLSLWFEPLYLLTSSEGGRLSNVKPDKVELPEINGMKGAMEGENIVYGCDTVLRAEWFISSNSRRIVELKLSDGTCIGKKEINGIREYFRNHSTFMSQMEMAQKMGSSVSLDEV